MRVQLDHLIPVAVGVTVRAEATLERVEGRRLTFTVSVNDERGLVAAGKVTRVVVNRERFLDKAQCRLHRRRALDRLYGGERQAGIRRGSTSGGRRPRGR